MTRFARRISAFTTSTLLAACGSTPSTPSTTPTDEPARAVLPDVPFAQLDQDQRVDFMEQVVVPALKPLFTEHDAKRFSGFGCVTCHGATALDGHYAMPNRELPRLDFDDLSSWKPADLEWMRRVKPAMAAVLRTVVWSEETPSGFGCEGCHPIE